MHIHNILWTNIIGFISLRASQVLLLNNSIVVSVNMGKQDKSVVIKFTDLAKIGNLFGVFFSSYNWLIVYINASFRLILLLTQDGTSQSFAGIFLNHSCFTLVLSELLPFKRCRTR